MEVWGFLLAGVAYVSLVSARMLGVDSQHTCELVLQAGEDLWTVCQKLHLDLDLVLQLNPSYGEAGHGLKGSTMRVPCQALGEPSLQQQSQQQPQQLQQQPEPQAHLDLRIPCNYRAISGETLDDVAARFEVPVNLLLSLNNQPQREEIAFEVMDPGQILMLPCRAAQQDSAKEGQQVQ